MKNFLTSMLGALAALVLFSAGCVLAFIIAVAAVAVVGEKKAVSVERGSYLVFDLSRNIPDGPAEPELDLGKEKPEPMQLHTITRALRAAAADPRLGGVFLTGSLEPEEYGAGFAALKEVREALLACRAAGKPVVAFMDFALARDVYLDSAASDVVADPYGAFFLPGLASEPMFYAGAFEKFGIGVQVTRVGKYKSFVEPFTRKDMSPESREQTQKLLNDVWSGIVGDIAESRGLEPAALQDAVDRHGIFTAEEARTAGLVDRIAYRDEVLAELKRRTGAGGKEAFKQIAIDDYAESLPTETAAKKKSKDRQGAIAVVYAEGDIVDGDGEDGEIGGDKFARKLRALRQDDDVKAIVLRVNSPGGSAAAAEEIQRELRLARKVKPVIVSMGTVAASGGYWISAYGDKIFAEPTTITGSIGVFGLFVNVQKLANNLGFTFDVVKTGKFADVLTISRPKTTEEMARFQYLVDWIYDQFVAKVAEGRHLERAQVEEIAQGRVWSGAEAKKLGLVDELGGLDAALKFAAERTGLGKNYRLIEYPQKKELADLLLEWLKGEQHRQADVLSRLIGQIQANLKSLRAFNDPRGVYARLPFEVTIK